MVALLGSAPADASMLDLGCDDGDLTERLATAAHASDVHGVELVAERAELAAQRGIAVSFADLSGPLPYEDEMFDVVSSHQVLEHVPDTDTSVRETFRVLKPGGFAVVSTENLASLHNILALVLGWQPFSLGNVTSQALGLGNPFAVHRGEPAPSWLSWQHQRVFAYRGLKELFLLHGFRVEKVVGAGYYPLPERLARLDPRHAAFLTIKARRPPTPP